jgi:UDP-glucose 4-epimerase
LLDACASISSIESVVVASTAAVYAPSDQAHAEESAIGPTDIYGLTKLWTEQMAGLFSKRTGTPTAVARLFNVYGPGETNPHLIPEILRQLEQGETLRLGNLTTKRDYVHVDDICRGLVMLDEARKRSDVLVCNLGNENAIDGHSLLTAMESALDVSIDVEFDEARLRRSPDRPLLLSDCSRAHRELGWYPEIDFTEGLLSAARQPFIAGSA